MKKTLHISGIEIHFSIQDPNCFAMLCKNSNKTSHGKKAIERLEKILDGFRGTKNLKGFCEKLREFCEEQNFLYRAHRNDYRICEQDRDKAGKFSWILSELIETVDKSLKGDVPRKKLYLKY